MKLKDLLEAQVTYNILESLIIQTMKESFVEIFDVGLNEGEQDADIMKFCRNSKGALLISGTDDVLLVSALEKLRTTNWSTIATKNECVQAIVNKLYKLSAKNCDITIDNPAVRMDIINSMEKLWKQAVIKIAKYQISDPAKALQDIKNLFSATFKKMKANVGMSV